MKKDKIRTFFKDFPFGLIIGVLVGVVAAVLAVLVKNFINEVITNLEFATGILAIATVILALVAVWTIWQNYRLHKKDREERWLNEIIEWAIDLKEPLYSIDVLEKQQLHTYAITHLRLTHVNARRTKIGTIARRAFTEDLFKAVEGVEKAVVQYLALLEFAGGIDEELILIDEKEKAEIRNKVEKARSKGPKGMIDIQNEYEKPLILSTTQLIEKCSQLITEL